MKLIGEITAGLAKDVADMGPPPDTGQNSVVRSVFGRMHAAYGTAWLDKWRTGVLDGNGRDRGVASAMVGWASALAQFDPLTVQRACKAVEERQDARFPPSKPEFIALCRAHAPRVPPPVALSSLVTPEEKRLAELNFAALRDAALINKPARGPLEKLHDLIADSVLLAGGRLEDLTRWQMVKR